MMSDRNQGPPQIQRVQLTPQKAPSPPYLSPVKPTEEKYNCPYLFELLKLNPADLQLKINELREDSIPVAKRTLHDLLKDHVRKINLT